MLCPGHASRDGDLAGFRVLGREHDGGEHARKRRERRELVSLEQAGEVPLSDVCDFVRKHRRELALGLGDDHQPCVYRDDAARPCECVDARCVDHEEPVAPLRIRARDTLPQRIHVVDDLEIVNQPEAAADLAEERFAEPFFFGAREGFTGCISEVGKPAFGRSRRCSGQRTRKAQDRSKMPTLARVVRSGGIRAMCRERGPRT